jgi:tetratricopeptide (TPR) repeat protein
MTPQLVQTGEHQPVLSYLNGNDSIPYAVQPLDRARHYIVEAKYEEALSYCRLAKLFAIGKGDGMANIYINMAICYEKTGRISESIRHYQAAEECIPQDANRSKRIAMLLINLAQLYNNLKDYHTAMTYIDSAMPYISKTRSNEGDITAFMIKAEILLQNGADNDRVIDAYREVFTMIETVKNPSKTLIGFKCVALASLAGKYTDKDLPDSAIYYLSLTKPGELSQLNI